MTTAEQEERSPAGTGLEVTAADVEVDERGWARVLRFWHTAFYVLVGFKAAAIVVADDSLAVQDLPSLVALAVLVLAYATFGQAAAARSLRDGPDRGAWAYLALLFAVTCFVTSLDPLGPTLLFVAYSQVWLLTPSILAGVWLSIVLAVASTGALFVRLRGLGEESWAAAFQMGLGLAFSLLMGLWVHWILRQGAQRAELLRSLQRAQAELGRTQHAAGVVAERERVAREIHDTLAQGFTSIVMLAQTASAAAQQGDHEQVGRRLDLIEHTARENLAEARALVTASSPAPLEASTLPEAIARLASRLTDETGVVVRTESTGCDALPSAAEVVLLRAVQEALSNVRRHALATSVEVTLAVDELDAVLTVTDDGRGRSPDAAEGFGLRGMRERVSACAGEIRVEDAVQDDPQGAGTARPSPGHLEGAGDGRSPETPRPRGTRVVVRIPSAPPAHAQGDDAAGGEAAGGVAGGRTGGTVSSQQSAPEPLRRST